MHDLAFFIAGALAVIAIAVVFERNIVVATIKTELTHIEGDYTSAKADVEAEVKAVIARIKAIL